MTIKLENFTATIDVESVELQSVIDDVNNKVATANIVINGELGASLYGFTYTDTWEDDDVLAWANIELEKYQVSSDVQFFNTVKK